MGDQLQDLQLAFRELALTHVLYELFGELRRDSALAGMHRSDGVQQLVSGRSFEKVGLRACLERPVNVFSFGKRRQYDDTRVWIVRSDRREHLVSRHRRQTQIEERDVGSMFDERRDRG